MKPIKQQTISFLRLHLRWVVIGLAAIISVSSILYTSSLVESIRAREKRQIEIFSSSVEFLANKGVNANEALIFDKIIKADNAIPVILTDENGNPEDYRNIKEAGNIKDKAKRDAFLMCEIKNMQEQYTPIMVTLRDEEDNTYGHKYIYYENSIFLEQLKFYPIVQLTVIAFFVLVIFFVFNHLKSSEQNRVWVGLARETAHQLGTPISSLMAWLENLKEVIPNQKEILRELEKDIDHLKIVTDRFSSIGSEPQLHNNNLYDFMKDVVEYLSKRISKKIKIHITAIPNNKIYVPINASLLAWVIENICKNAVDAMNGVGTINITILQANEGRVAVDISDEGKGIAKSKIQQVFSPGYTTKKRGWGLGLTLARRIIEQYHKGKIFVKDSEVSKGTTFRIFLNRKG